MVLTADLRMYRHSGIGRYLRNVFPLLLPLLHADKVRVLAPSSLVDGATWLSDPRVELIDTPAPIYSIAEQLLPFRGAYSDSRLLWVPHYNAPLVYRGRMIVTIHDLAPLAMPQLLGSAVKRAYAGVLMRSAVRHASAILAVSNFTRGELVDRLHVPPQKITVTHAGLESDWQPEAPHRESDGVPYLLFVGNVKPNKNLGLLLRAFAKVRDRVPFRLLLVGRMTGFLSADQAVIHQAESFGDRVRFTGEVSDVELRSFYAGATALVLPSLYEGFGLPLLEAMQLGCPVLCSTAGSLPEVGGDAALYFDPHSEQELSACLLQTLDRLALETLRSRGYTRVSQFSFERCAQQSAAVMNPLLESA